jgi:hypothetical protein
MATTSSDGPTAAPPAPPAATPPPPASELHPNCEVLSSRAITLLFTIIRDKRTTQRDYVAASDRLMTLLAEEGLARLPAVVPATVATPCGAYAGLAGPPSHMICGVDIVRSGGILLEAVRKIAPDSKTAKILIQRDEETAEPKAWRIRIILNSDLESKGWDCDRATGVAVVVGAGRLRRVCSPRPSREAACRALTRAGCHAIGFRRPSRCRVCREQAAARRAHIHHR